MTRLVSHNSALEQRLPGDLAIWFFILAELTVFAIFFIGFAVTEQLNPQMFLDGKLALHPIAGLINTVSLISSSLFVALSLQYLHENKRQKTFICLVLAFLLACLYVAVKMWEYQVLFGQGFNLETNTFFTLYFLITGFHFSHLILGMIILIFMMIKAHKINTQEGVSGFESGACYWHMLDMLWVVLFPLIYVI